MYISDYQLVTRGGGGCKRTYTVKFLFNSIITISKLYGSFFFISYPFNHFIVSKYIESRNRKIIFKRTCVKSKIHYFLYQHHKKLLLDEISHCLSQLTRCSLGQKYDNKDKIPKHIITKNGAILRKTFK